jgi:hypothetical protein
MTTGILSIEFRVFANTFVSNTQMVCLVLNLAPIPAITEPTKL